MAKMQFSVKCQVCNNTTTDPSSLCHLHRDLNASAVRTKAFGKGLVPKIQTDSKMVNNDSLDLYLSASSIKEDIDNGATYELDITDGYGEEFEDIDSITEAGKPNEGLLAFNTKNGITIYFSPDEFVDVRAKESAVAA
jgi:hypothetical protein